MLTNPQRGAGIYGHLRTRLVLVLRARLCARVDIFLLRRIPLFSLARASTSSPQPPQDVRGLDIARLKRGVNQKSSSTSRESPTNFLEALSRLRECLHDLLVHLSRLLKMLLHVLLEVDEQIVKRRCGYCGERVRRKCSYFPSSNQRFATMHTSVCGAGCALFSFRQTSADIAHDTRAQQR